MNEKIGVKNKKIFLSGGCGFIGTALLKQLVADNKIVVFDNGQRNALKYTNLRHHPNFQFVRGSILDLEKLMRSVRKIDIVIHLAAIAGIESVGISPRKTMEVNLIGTYNLLEAVKNHRLSRFVYFSTSEVYGPYVFRADEERKTTQGSVDVLRWRYSVSKLAGEHLAHSYFTELDLPLVILRPFNIYGPRQIGEGAVHKFVSKAIRNEDLEIYGDGNQIRSWCYIEDMVSAVLKALEEPRAVGNVFNIGNPTGTITILGLAEKIIELANSKSSIVFKESSYPDVELRVPSIEKAQRLLGFTADIRLDEGLKRTINWYRDNQETIR